jgi:hypothetical protein
MTEEGPELPEKYREYANKYFRRYFNYSDEFGNFEVLWRYVGERSIVHWGREGKWAMNDGWVIKGINKYEFSDGMPGYLFLQEIKDGTIQEITEDQWLLEKIQ